MKITKLIKVILFYMLVIIIVIWCISPFIWQIVTSFRPDKYITQVFPIITKEQTLDHYINVFTGRPFEKYIINSLVVASITTLLCLIVGTFASYSLARLRIKAKGPLLGLILTVSMFPQIAIVTSLYIVIKNIGMLNTYIALIIPYMTFALPLTIWVLTNFFMDIPYELEEAAKIDGCSPFTTFLRIILPLGAPAIFTAAILVFISAWNEFLFALTFTSDISHQTVPVGIAMLPVMYHVPWGDIAAASVIVTMPLIIMVFMFQKRIISGLTSGAVKG